MAGIKRTTKLPFLTLLFTTITHPMILSFNNTEHYRTLYSLPLTYMSLTNTLPNTLPKSLFLLKISLFLNQMIVRQESARKEWPTEESTQVPTRERERERERVWLSCVWMKL